MPLFGRGIIKGKNMKRGRNQRRRPGGGSNPNRALDSNGPDVRIRGTATQIYDKYQALARDASSSGDRVKAESYLQHAEHYFRLIRSMQPAQAPGQHPNAHDGDSDQPGMDDGDNDGDNQNQNHQREQRAPREQRDNGADARNEPKEEKAAPADKDPEAKSGANDGDQDEERKPRRRRAPRRSASKDAADSSDKTPAAAE